MVETLREVVLAAYIFNRLVSFEMAPLQQMPSSWLWGFHAQDIGPHQPFMVMSLLGWWPSGSLVLEQSGLITDARSGLLPSSSDAA